MPETGPATSRGLSLLGGWQLVADGETVALGGREQRLCALLALTGTRARAQVAGTLWPESTDARALASLRRAVAQTHQRVPGLLAADRTHVGLAADVVVDVDELREAVSRAGSPDADGSLLRTLEGEALLPGWYDEWVEAQREDLQRQRVEALERLARRALERGDAALAEDAARTVARIEPLRESASELVIRALLARQDRAGAVRELERYRELVGAELGVVPSPALVALVEAVAVPAQVPVAVPVAAPVLVRPAESRERPEAPRVVIPAQRRALPPEQPPPPDPLFPMEPAGLSFRAAAARLAVGAALVITSSLAIANLGPEGEEPAPAPAAEGSHEQPTADREKDAREVLVRPVAAAAGAAAFVVQATLRPARVRLEVGGPSGRNVVRRVVVRSSQGQRLVVGGLDGGTYQWSATSPTAAPVTGEVRVAEERSRVLAAAAEPSPSPTRPTSTPTPTPTSTPTTTPTVSPSHPASPTPDPSPTRQPSPTSEPTDPGTQDPGLVG